jgi:hypothetical protein
MHPDDDARARMSAAGKAAACTLKASQQQGNATLDWLAAQESSPVQRRPAMHCTFVNSAFELRPQLLLFTLQASQLSDKGAASIQALACLHITSAGQNASILAANHADVECCTDLSTFAGTAVFLSATSFCE